MPSPSYSFDPSSQPLRDKVRTNVKLSLLGQAARFLLGLASTVVLARMLDPTDYGLTAMAASVTAVMMAFRESGLGMATIQSPTITHDEVSGLFWANIGLGLGVAVLCVPIGWVSADLMGQAEVFPIIVAQGAVGIVSSLCTQHNAILQRRLEMNLLVKRDIWGQAVGLVAGILAAWAGLRYWSLIVMQGVAAAVTTFATWQSCPWRPGHWRTVLGVKDLVKFGWTVMASSLIDRVMSAIPSAMIGGWFGPAAAGLYNRAQGLVKRPLDQVLSPIMSAIRPAMGRTQGDAARFSRVTLELLRLIAFVAPLLVSVLVPLSDLIIRVLYGSAWMAATPMFAALSLFALVDPWSYVFSTAIVAWNKPKALLYWKCFSVAAVFVSFWAVLKWGPTACAWSYSLSGLIIRIPLFMVVAARVSPLRYRDLAAATFPGLLNGLAAVAVSYGVAYGLADRGLVARGLSATAASVAVYGVLTFVQPWTRVNALLFWDHVKKTVAKKKVEPVGALPEANRCP